MPRPSACSCPASVWELLLGAFSLVLISRQGPRPWILLGGGMGLSLTLIAIGFQNSYAFTAVLLALSGLVPGHVLRHGEHDGAA